MATIGAIIKQKRQVQSLKSKRLAEILGINPTLLSRYEHDQRKISKRHAPIIKSYLDGDFDREILNNLINELMIEYKHLANKKGLGDLWQI